MFKNITLLVVTIFLILIGTVFLFAKDIEISVPEVEAQATINESLLGDTQGKNGIFASSKKIIIDFKSDNLAQISGSFDLSGYGYSGEFDGSFSTGINYRPPSLYLNDLSLVSGGFSATDTVQSELNDMKKVAIDILHRQRQRIKVDKSGVPLNTSEEKSAEIINELVVSAMKKVFESIPIYNVSQEGLGGLAASFALKEVRFTEENAIVTLSPVTALLRLLSILCSICLIGLWALLYVMNFGFILPSVRKPKD